MADGAMKEFFMREISRLESEVVVESNKAYRMSEELRRQQEIVDDKQSKLDAFTAEYSKFKHIFD